MRFPRHLTFLGLFYVLLNAGCNRGRELKALYPARGQVFFDGKPAKGARVVFHPVGAPDPRAILPQAQVADDGTFVLSTYNFEDGAPQGSYSVTVVKMQGNGPVNLLLSRYENPATSGLEVQIEKRDNELPPFNLNKDYGNWQ